MACEEAPDEEGKQKIRRRAKRKRTSENWGCSQATVFTALLVWWIFAQFFSVSTSLWQVMIRKALTMISKSWPFPKLLIFLSTGEFRRHLQPPLQLSTLTSQQDFPWCPKVWAQLKLAHQYGANVLTLLTYLWILVVIIFWRLSFRC